MLRPTGPAADALPVTSYSAVAKPWRGGGVLSQGLGGKDVELLGAAYLSSSALPNFYFHVTTAYNILRHNGLEIGKGDFLGRNLS